MDATGRRDFLRKAGGAAVAAVAGGVLGGAAPARAATDEPEPLVDDGLLSAADRERAQEAYEVRVEAALAEKLRPFPAHPVNGDETRYASFIGQFSKGLPHNDLGEVEPLAYQKFLGAVEQGTAEAYEGVPLGGTAKLVNPMAGVAFALEGADSYHLAIPAPPAFASAWEASEMAEVYWQALTRDVAFSSYAADPVVLQAADDLSRFTDFRGPKAGGKVTPATLFRASTAGDLAGPYISQYLFKDVPYGMYTIKQQLRAPVPNVEHLTNYVEWLGVTRGLAPFSSLTFDATPRHIRNGRDLSEYVHRDFTYQAFLNAALILLSQGTPFDPANPYRGFASQAAFSTFGGPDVLDAVATVANLALKAAWHQKWNIHRRLRPEVFAGRVHNHVTNRANYPIHQDLLRSGALPLVFSRHGSYCLPMAYPEGSPLHPAYPAGHATIAGACVTVLKAFFDETAAVASPVEASPDGTALVPVTGVSLTVGGELNKLASNISIGRDTAGVHWRTDGVDGMRLGEAVAIAMLRDRNGTYRESFEGFTLTKFDGTVVTI